MNSVSDFLDYRNVCKSASEDELIFQNFKRDSVYRMILEHVTEEEGYQYLYYIKQNYEYLIQKLDLFKKNDLIGNPIKYNFGEFGDFSPTTLRYIKVLGDMYSIFGDLSGKKIIEIGGGYGGQSLILHQFFQPSSYTIVDLEEVNALTNRYLSRHDINASFVSPDDVSKIDTDFDLVISNYAYSEVNRELQTIYFEKIIRFSTHGYLILNFMDHQDEVKLERYSKQEIFGLFSKKNFKIAEEIPKTYCSNFLLYF